MHHWAILSLCEYHRGHLHKPRWSSLLHTWAGRYSLWLLGCNPIQHVTMLGMVGNCNSMVNFVYLDMEKVQEKFDLEDQCRCTCRGRSPCMELAGQNIALGESGSEGESI